MARSFDYKILAKKRAAAGLTQEALSRKACLSLTGYSLVENGRRKPMAETLMRIAAALKTRMEVFFK